MYPKKQKKTPSSNKRKQSTIPAAQQKTPSTSSDSPAQQGKPAAAAPTVPDRTEEIWKLEEENFDMKDQVLILEKKVIEKVKDLTETNTKVCFCLFLRRLHNKRNE